MPRRVPQQLLLLLCVLLGAGGAQAQGRAAAQELTLERALQLALVHSPQVVQAAGAVRTAHAGVRSAWGAWLPAAGLSANGAYTSSERFNPQVGTSVTGSNFSYSASLNAAWDVFTGGRRGAEWRRAQAQLELAQSQLFSDRASAALLVEQAFFGTLRAKELQSVASARVKRAEEALAAARRRLSVGSATRSDVLRAELELNTAKQSLLQEDTNFGAAAFALGRLVGFDGPAEPKAERSVEVVLPAVLEGERQVEVLAGEAPVVRAAEAGLRVASAGVASAWSQYLPSVRLSSSYTLFNQNPALQAPRTGWSVGLGLSFTLFDGFAREAGIERARVQELVAEAQLADTRRAVRAEASRALGEVRLARERIGLAQQSVQVAQEDLRVQQDRYRLGVSTMLDLLTSQTNLVEAENNLVAARFDYQLARAELEALAGLAP